MANQIIDWGRIRSEYVTTTTSYKRLAVKHGVARSAICQRGRDEGWVEMRDRYRSELGAKIREEAQERGLAALRQVGEIAEEALVKIRTLLEDPGNGTQTEALLSALKMAAALVRDVYGLPTVEQQHRQEIDREKLALEREKARRGIDDEPQVVEFSIVGAEDYAL